MQPNTLEIPPGFGQIGSLALDKPLNLLDPPKPVTVAQNDTLQTAIEVLQECHIGCAVVVDGTGALSGMLSERDILLKWIFSGANPAEVTVEEVMTPNPTHIFSDSTIAAALYLMSKGGFRHLPIVDKSNMPVGVVSVKDITDFISMEFMRNLLGK